MASQMIRVCWDISDVVIDEEEFEIIKMMVQDAGADQKAGLPKLRVVIDELKKQGYTDTRARTLALLARGFLTGQACSYRV